MIAFSKIEEASFSESREPNTTDHFFKSALTELKHVKLAAPTTGKCEGYKEACGDKRNSTRADTSITLSKAKVSHISRSALYSRGNQKTLQLSSRISLWKVTSSKAKLGDLGDSYYMVYIAFDQA
ncbi:hypothetical protein ACFXTI_005861 [Malus domestica]